jgi:hypothetical protein
VKQHRGKEREQLIGSLLLLITIAMADTAGGVSSPGLHWCPAEPQRERLVTVPRPGCYPLVDEPVPNESLDRIDLHPRLTLENNAGVVARFIWNYRMFLTCCATSPASLDLLVNLEQQASHILKQQVNLLPIILLQTGQGKGLILPVVRARHELRRLKARLEELAEIQASLETIDDTEIAARERRRIEDLIVLIEQDFAPPREAVTAAITGPDIGTLPPGGRIGLDIGIQPPFGSAIGATPLTGAEIGITPPTGEEIGTTPPTGEEIGTTPPTGPEIADPINKLRP